MPRRSIVGLVVPQAANGGFSRYARMLEAAATTASSEAGFPPEWYAAEATAWVIRRSTIDCGVEIPAGVAIEITTWVADFRRVRSRREYEGRVAGELVLTGHTDWVYVQRPNGKPLRIPEAMMRAFVPEGGGEAIPRTAFGLGDPPADAKSIEWTVELADVDALDHVNNAKYFDYLEAAARAVIGADLRPSAHDVEYLDEARAGEELRATSWVASSADSTIETATEIRRAHDGAMRTRARSTWRR